jgi:hypothetical protein
MSEPTVRIKADRTQRIYVLENEVLIVSPERAEALAGFCSPVAAESTAIEAEDRRVRSKKEK